MTLQAYSFHGGNSVSYRTKKKREALVLSSSTNVIPKFQDHIFRQDPLEQSVRRTILKAGGLDLEPQFPGQVIKALNHSAVPNDAAAETPIDHQGRWWYEKLTAIEYLATWRSLQLFILITVQAVAERNRRSTALKII